MAKRQLTGQVVSDKMPKTVVVKVGRIKVYPKYQARFKLSQKYKAHDENKECKVGDWVVIEECRPLSRDKRLRIIKKVSQA